MHGDQQWTPHLNPGQHTWEMDDKTGVLKILENPTFIQVKLLERLWEENIIKKIFASVVDLVDIHTMKVAQSAFTDRDGYFSFNVDKSKKYFLFYCPFEFTESFSMDYLASFSNFCYNGSQYKYTALSSCLNSEDDSPSMLIFDKDDEIRLGEIGIKCDI